jgi:hypothetical protein
MNIPSLMKTGAGCALVMFSVASHAHTHIGVYLGFAPAYPPPPVVYAPAPTVIYQPPPPPPPPPVYVPAPPPPVYVSPPPVIYEPAPNAYDGYWSRPWWHYRRDYYDQW